MSTAEAEIQTQQMGVTVVYDKMIRVTKPIILSEGGADSSKSYSIAQLLIQKFKTEYNKVFLITRKTLPSLKLTAYKLIIDILKDYGHYKYLKHNKSEHTLYYRAHNNLMVFLSVDDPEKIKSTEFNYIWMEEAGEFTWDDFTILKLRLRAKTKEGEPNRMYLSLNPIDEQGWINQRLKKQSDVEIIHSTYKDNPFAQTADIDVLEGLKGQDESYYRIYALGLYAKLKGQIYDLIEVDSFPDVKETIYGVDFGFENPSVLLEIGIDADIGALYFTEHIHESKLTNPEFIEKMKENIPKKHRKRDMYADSARPDNIEEICDEGFNCKPSLKGTGSVIDGINFLNRFKLYTLKDGNINFNFEMRRYKRKVNKNGDVLEEPVKFKDHCPDAARYGVHTHLRERFLDKGPLWIVSHETKIDEIKEGEMEDQELKKEGIERIRNYDYIQLGIFARLMNMDEEEMRQRLKALGFEEHESMRFIYSKDFWKKEIKEEKLKKEDRDDDVWIF